MSRISKVVFALFCLIALPYFSMAATDTFIAPNDIFLQKDYQNTQLIYKVPKGAVMTLKSSNGNWYNISYNAKGEEVNGWVSMEQPQTSTDSNTTGSTTGTTTGSANNSVPTGGGLTLDQQAYLREYTYTYVKYVNERGLYKYSTSHAANDNSYDGKLTNGQVIHDCSAFCASMLHQTVDAPLKGERNRKDTGIYGTGFANPGNRGSDVFFAISGNGVLEPGDVLTHAGYSIHAVLYLGYNSVSGYHEVAEASSQLKITKLVSREKAGGETLTLAQVRANTVYKEASRVKHSVLPDDWTMPSSVVINLK